MGYSKRYQRYERQVMLKGFGTAGQDRLRMASVLVVGAGGLGCPALQYLAAAGVGIIGIVDFDVVELTNLQRQTLFNVEDIERPKATAAAEKLSLLNPDVHPVVYQTRLSTANALEIIDGYDIVIDGTDNFATRYLINDACVLRHKTLVYGSVLRFEGQVGVLNFTDKSGNTTAGYRDLFPLPPSPGTIPSCSDAGVLGVLPGIIGTMQASEAIKIITGIGKPLTNTILCYNALENLFYEFHISPLKNKGLSPPGTVEEFKNFNYQWFCRNDSSGYEISPAEFETLRKNEDITIIDVREPGELPLVDEFSHLKIPLNTFEMTIAKIEANEKVVIFCKSGQRSMTAVKLFDKARPGHQSYSLSGGIEGWKRLHYSSEI